MKKVLFVVAPTGYQDRELAEPKAELEKAGFSAVVVSTIAGTARGALGGSVRAQALPESSDGYDAIVFVGGGGVDENGLPDDARILALANDFASKRKAVAAICIAPRILAKAGVLRGKKATAFPDAETIAMLREAGAEYAGASVERDGKIVTADGPSSARAFGKAISEAI